MTQVQHPHTKSCRYCSAKITWDDAHHYFAENGKRHDSPTSSAKDRQLESDKRLNLIINDLRLELDSKFDALREDISNQQNSTQKAVASCKAQINELYHLFKTHKCYVE
jgi:hypothetical protein